MTIQNPAHDQLPFKIEGVLPRAVAHHLISYAGALARQHEGTMTFNFEDSSELVSPSVVAEYRLGIDWVPKLVVTAASVEEFILAEEWDTTRPHSESKSFIHWLYVHSYEDHEGGMGLGRGENKYGRQCRGCNCPLQAIPVRHHKFPHLGEEYLGALDPITLIQLSELPANELQRALKGRLGAKRIKLLRVLATRLRRDLSSIPGSEQIEVVE